MTKARLVFCLSVLPLAIPAGTGCSERRTAADDRRADASPPPPPGHHAVQEAKVRAIMQRIAAGTASWPQDLPPQIEQVLRPTDAPTIRPLAA